MTEAEYNTAIKELDIVLLDVDYKQFDSVVDVAKFVIQLNKINENILAKENAELKEKYSNLQQNMDTRIKGCNDEIYRLHAQIEKQKEINKDYVDEVDTLREIISHKEIDIAKLQADISKCEETIDRLNEDIEDCTGEMEARTNGYYEKLNKIKKWFISNEDNGDKILEEITKEN